MAAVALPPHIARLVAQLEAVPGVVAVALGGSRADGTARPESDWDIGLYYRPPLDVDAIRRLGHPGDVWGPGAWGPVMNGGACLLVDDTPVDIIYRDMDAVAKSVAESAAGRFHVAQENGIVCGVPSYLYAVELQQSQVLAGRLPAADLPPALADAARAWWHADASFAWETGAKAAARGDGALCAALLARAVIAESRARLDGGGRWVTNEKGIAEKAGLSAASRLLRSIGTTPARMVATARALRGLLAIPEPPDLVARRALIKAGVLEDGAALS